MNMNGTNGVNHSAQPETNHYATVPENTSTGQTEAPSDDTRGYHVARGPRDNYQTTPDVPLELYSQPNNEKKYVSNDYGYANAHGATGPYRWDEERVSRMENGDVAIGHKVTPGVVSAGVNSRSPGVIYTEVQRKRRQQVDNGDPPSESDMVMVENDLYHCVNK